MNSKILQRNDWSLVAFMEEMLGNEENYALNFDRLSYDFSSDKFILMEFQKVSEEKIHNGVSPWESHPVRYWDRCWRKYVVLWKAVQRLQADFYIVNYCEPGLPCSNEIRVMQVFSLNRYGIRKWSDWKTDRKNFSTFLREMNARCCGSLEDLSLDRS